MFLWPCCTQTTRTAAKPPQVFCPSPRAHHQQGPRPCPALCNHLSWDCEVWTRAGFQTPLGCQQGAGTSTQSKPVICVRVTPQRPSTMACFRHRVKGTLHVSVVLGKNPAPTFASKSLPAISFCWFQTWLQFCVKRIKSPTKKPTPLTAARWVISPASNLVVNSTQ